MNPMKTTLFLLGSVLLAVLPASGTTTIYTNQASFLAALDPGSYDETFDGFIQGNTLPSPLNFSQGGFGYSAAVADGSPFYTEGVPGDTYLSTNTDARAIVFTPTGGNINAIGGDFFLTDTLGAFFQGTVSLSLDDGTTTTLTNPAGTGFLGFISSVPIGSLTFTSPAAPGYATVNNLIVGQAVPEPSTWLLLAGGVLPLASRLRRRSEHRVLEA